MTGSKYWRPAAAALAAGALALSSLSPAFAQTEENAPPEPQDDAATTAFQTSVQIDVLANDSDPDGQGIFLADWTQGTDGSVDVIDAIVTYTPNEGFSGEDTFEYTVSDGELTTTATVTIIVEEAPVVEAPVALDDSATTASETAVVIDVLANDTGADGVELTIESVTEPANGTAEIVEGAVTYTPNADFAGDDTFQYTITDGATSATATVTITVEEAVGPGVLDPDVVAACEAYDGDDASTKLLCRVYLSGNLSPFVQQIVGSIILLTAPVPEPDPVLVACEAHAGDPTVDALCGVYQTEGLPNWLKEGVGDLILRLTEEAAEDSD